MLVTNKRICVADTVWYRPLFAYVETFSSNIVTSFMYHYPDLQIRGGIEDNLKTIFSYFSTKTNVVTLIRTVLMRQS